MINIAAIRAANNIPADKLVADWLAKRHPYRRARILGFRPPPDIHDDYRRKLLHDTRLIVSTNPDIPDGITVQEYYERGGTPQRLATARMARTIMLRGVKPIYERKT